MSADTSRGLSGAGCYKMRYDPPILNAEALAECARLGGRSMFMVGLRAFFCGTCAARHWSSRLNTSVVELVPFEEIAMDFAIIGFPKAGTTTLFNGLWQHPELLFPSEATEESFFFEPRTRTEVRTLEERFLRASAAKGTSARLRGIWSPMMVQSMPALDALRRVRGARIIVLVRDPLQMFQSYLGNDNWPPWTCSEHPRLDLMEQSVWLMSCAHWAREGRMLLLPFEAVRYAPALAMEAVAKFLGIVAPPPEEARRMLRWRNPTMKLASQRIGVCEEVGGMDLFQALRELYAMEAVALRGLLRRFFFPALNRSLGGRGLAIDDARSGVSRLLAAPMACRRARRRGSVAPGPMLAAAVCRRGAALGCWAGEFTCERCCFGDDTGCWTPPHSRRFCCRQPNLGAFVETGCPWKDDCYRSTPGWDALSLQRVQACVGEGYYEHESTPECEVPQDVLQPRREAARALFVDSVCHRFGPGGCCVDPRTTTGQARAGSSGICLYPPRHAGTEKINARHVCCT